MDASVAVNTPGGVGEAAGNFQCIHPFAMDPVNPSRLWYGGAFAWRSVNRGTNWTRISNSFGARIASWAISAVDPNRAYVGVQHLGTVTSGRVFTTGVATTLAGPVTWASAQPRQGYVSSVAVDTAGPLIAYATYSTYNFGTQLGHVFKTIDGGSKNPPAQPGALPSLAPQRGLSATEKREEPRLARVFPIRNDS